MSVLWLSPYNICLTATQCISIYSLLETTKILFFCPGLGYKVAFDLYVLGLEVTLTWAVVRPL